MNIKPLTYYPNLGIQVLQEGDDLSIPSGLRVRLDSSRIDFQEDDRGFVFKDPNGFFKNGTFKIVSADAIVFNPNALNTGNSFSTVLRSNASSQTTGLTFTLPGTLGSGQDILATDGSGNWYWRAKYTPSDIGALAIAENLADLSDVADARENIGAGVATWNANKIQGNDVSAISPDLDEFMGWDGSQWKPTPIDGGIVNW